MIILLVFNLAFLYNISLGIISLKTHFLTMEQIMNGSTNGSICEQRTSARF